MYCKNCGHSVGKGKRFCPNCGAPVRSKSFISAGTAWSQGAMRRLNKLWIIGLAGIAIIILALVVSFLFFKHSGAKIANTGSKGQDNKIAVVDINCDNGKGGSGTIFSTDGTVLTNNHVIVGAKNCEITIPDPATGQISEIYEAVPVIVPKLSQKYDVATLRIDGAYTDSNGKTWGVYPTTFTAFQSPSTCDSTKPSQLGDSLRIYGYPVTSGGYNLTVTDGIVSSFTDSGYILTSAKVDSGNSGGLAIDQNGCWLGIPSAVLPGNYQNLGVIIPGNIIAANFLNAVPAKADPAAIKSPSSAAEAETAATPHLTNDQQCQNNFGSNSQWSGYFDSSNQPTCKCSQGYSWDGTGNACALISTLQKQCQDEYGAGSYSSTQGGKAMCGCSSGYVWNSDQSACVIQETSDQQCQDHYGPYGYWTGGTNAQGGPLCDCESGYAWNSSQTACVVEPSCPIYSTYNSTSDKCECWTGYVANGGTCESALNYCQDVGGYGATYDYSTNSCACSPGYMSSGGTCVSGYTYCEDYGGVFDMYNSLTNKCECMAGYEWNGSSCVSSY